MFSDIINTQLRDLTAQGLYRKRSTIQSHRLNFSSNDYLSLNQDKIIAAAYQQGFKKYPAGSGGSAVICGYHSSHQALEKAFAELLQTDDSILFSSGYAANIAVINLLTSLKLHCFIDKSIHASIYDGLQMSKASFSRYHHNDIEDFLKKITIIPAHSIVLTEGIFSMSGQQAPLNLLANACMQKKIPLIVDEAHAFGIIGKEGAGAVVKHGLDQKSVPLRIIPLGKACAGQGAIVAGVGIWIEALIQSARSYIYSTALSPALAYGLLKTLDIIIAADTKRAKLRNLIHIFKQEINNTTLQWTDSHTPIQQLCLGDPKLALKVGDNLAKAGILCMPMRAPTVSRANTGLRIILNSSHEPEDIYHLFYHLKQALLNHDQY